MDEPLFLVSERPLPYHAALTELLFPNLYLAGG